MAFYQIQMSDVYCGPMPCKENPKGRVVVNPASEIKLVPLTHETEEAADSIRNVLGSQG
jgi:hypothetical protein